MGDPLSGSSPGISQVLADGLDQMVHHGLVRSECSVDLIPRAELQAMLPGWPRSNPYLRPHISRRSAPSMDPGRSARNRTSRTALYEVRIQLFQGPARPLRCLLNPALRAEPPRPAPRSSLAT